MHVFSRSESEYFENERVRRNTPSVINRKIDRQTERNIQQGISADRNERARRLRELEREWDIERMLEFNASALALTGLALGVIKDRRWLALPGVVLGFLLQHSVQGWCPPLPLFRALGVRTRQEIDREKYALLQAGT